MFSTLSNTGITISATLNPLQIDIFLDMTKLKAFAADISNVAKITIFLFDKENSNNILDCTKLKAFPGNKINVPQMTLVFDRLKNFVGKGENAGYQQFLLYQ